MNLALAIVLAVLGVWIGYAFWRKQNPKEPGPPLPPTGSATATVAVADQKKKWEWKKFEWSIPFMVWVIILVGLAINFSDQFWSWVWWTDHWKLVLVTNIVVLGFVILWYNEAGKTGKRLATTALLLILALTYGTHYQWIPKDWKKWSLREIQQALTLPPPVAKALEPPVDYGVKWTPATNNGKSALLCVLKPGETSAVVNFLSPRFTMNADSDKGIIAIVNGREFFLGSDEVISEKKSSEMGLNRLGCKPILRYKVPENEPRDVPIRIVFK